LKGVPAILKGFTSTPPLLISLLGLCLVAVLTFNNANSGADYPWRKPLIGSIFSSVCILGTLSAFFPSKCSQIIHFETQNGERTSSGSDSLSPLGKKPQLRGHHPSCEKFSAHILLIGNRTLCAGCSGLALGAIASLIGTSLYFFANFSLNSGYLFIFWAGFIGVAGGLLQYHLFKVKEGSVHFLLNSAFVLGAFLLLMGADAMTSNLSVGIYILSLDIFWIYTRIELSRWNHSVICSNCKLEKCQYHLRRSL